VYKRKNKNNPIRKKAGTGLAIGITGRRAAKECAAGPPDQPPPQKEEIRMYKVICAFLCGFFTYGVATRVLPNHAPVHTALAAPAAAPAQSGGGMDPRTAPSLLGVDAVNSATRLLPIYVPTQGADATCADAGRVCAWSI
jgi:hypothetical protein